MTDLADLKPGDHVRVTRVVEGVVSDRTDRGYLWLNYKENQSAISHVISKNNSDVLLTVEKIVPPDPPLIISAMYVDAKGCYWSYDEWEADRGELAACWYSPGDSRSYPFERPVRPLRRLVPDTAQ